MEGGRQLRLLLWKDYLVRKRKVITLAGIIWASAVMLSLHIVRRNIDNDEVPTCGFPARALPSAGMVPFLQSFICEVNNDCLPLDQFDEIPTYESSKLTQLSRRLSSVFNDSTLDVVASVPDALKLLGTLADIIDEPAFLQITQQGLRVSDLFAKPSRVKRLVAEAFDLDDNVTNSIMEAQVNLQGIIKDHGNKCDEESVSNILVINNREHLEILAEKLCSKTKNELQTLVIDVLLEVDYPKYVTMVGDMYYKLSGDERIMKLRDMLIAVVRMLNLDNFIPPEVASILNRNEVDFSYIQLDLIPKLINLFNPMFKDTQTYGVLQDLSDTLVVGLKFLDKLLVRIRSKEQEKDGVAKNGGVQAISNVLHHATDIIKESMTDDSMDAFSALTQMTNFILKFLSADTKHEVLFYSTLLTKLIENAHSVIYINMHIETLTYDATLRHPKAIEIIRDINPTIMGQAFTSLADFDRTEVLISRVNAPERLFCDVEQLKEFFDSSNRNYAGNLRKTFCTDVWINYVKELIKVFGVFEVKSRINQMASLLIQETLGKDTSEQLYTIEYDFKVLKNFINALIKMNNEKKPTLNWEELFEVDPKSELMQVLEEKAYLGKRMLIILHGVTAKHIIQQNTILDFKITPFLENTITLTAGINEQLALTPDTVTKQMKDAYYTVLKIILMTALNEKKTYKCLSTNGVDILCNTEAVAGQYLELQESLDTVSALEAMCSATREIEKGLEPDSPLTLAVKNMTMNTSRSKLTTDWKSLINNITGLYVKLYDVYPYLFNYSQYGMDHEQIQDVDKMLGQAKEFWFGEGNIGRSLHLSLKLFIRFLDILDYEMFDMRSSEYWLQIKNAISISAGPISIFNETVHLVTAFLKHDNYNGDLPPTTVSALKNVIPHIADLTTDAADIIAQDHTRIEPIIELLNSEPPWPCSGSITKILLLSARSTEAVKSLETIFCMNREFQEEWIKYLEHKNATFNGTTPAWNRNDYAPHLFLKFSSGVDALIEDIILIKDALDRILDDQSELKQAWKYAVDTLNTTRKHFMFSTMFTKVDKAINAVDTSYSSDDVSPSRLWQDFVNCSQHYIDRNCSRTGRKAWKYFLGTFSIILENIATDLMTYFQEVNERNSTILQLFGFTRNTGLYMLYDKMPEFVNVLFNSYFDYGFMSQIRRASHSYFWDCEAVVTALIPPPRSIIDRATLKKVQPFVCPSLLHWLSLPTGENTLLDIFAKPQYFFYTLPVHNITSNYTAAYNKAIELAEYITDLSNKNQTLLSEDDIKINSIQGKLKVIVDKVLSYKITKDDTRYRAFTETSFKQFNAHVYLTRIVIIVNKILDGINKFQASEIINATDKEIQSLDRDLNTIKYLFKRRPVDAIAIHFDVITDVLYNNRERNNLIVGLNKICNDMQSAIISTILISDTKAISQFCSKNYTVIYKKAAKHIAQDMADAKESLVNLINVFNTNGSDVQDIFEFLGSRKELISSLMTSIKHSYELGLPVYLKYLWSNINHYGVILKFLSGEDWWAELTSLYNGPLATKFFKLVEKSIEIAQELLTNFDAIHIVRLLHDINLNDTESFCQPNITLSDYLPDSTGIFSDLKFEICKSDKTELFKDIAPLLFASQGYDNALKISNGANYITMSSDILMFETNLDRIKEGPEDPQRPPWVTEENLNNLRQTVEGLLSKQSLTKIAFAVLSNGVDAGTLFLNNSQCTVCSQLTTWLKQLNLQLFKKQEYDTLLCHLDTMTLDEVHSLLKNNFHWDMAIHELISTRNYTKYEMNKSMNEFLGQVRLFLLEDLSANSTKLTDCLAMNITRNEIGNATLFAAVLAHAGKLLRAELPHIHEIDGIKNVQYLMDFSKEIAHNIVIKKPVIEFLTSDNKLYNDLIRIGDQDFVNNIEVGQIVLHKLGSSHSIDAIIPHHNNWTYYCYKYDCNKIADVIFKNINTNLVNELLPKYQLEEFWRFNFISDIVKHIEGLISHVGRLLGVASRVDLPGILAYKLDAMLDTALLLLNDEILDSIIYSLQGLRSELYPLLEGRPLDDDLKALSGGMNVLRSIKNNMIEEMDLNINVKQFFLNPENIESELMSLGIKNTNFWSLAAPRLRAGYIKLKPLLTAKQWTPISAYVCQLDIMSTVLEPEDLNNEVTADDVFSAVTEQFCDLPDETVKQILPILFSNFNYTAVLDQLKTTLLAELYTATNITEAEGSAVFTKYPLMAALLPTLQDNVDYVSHLFSTEPLFQSLSSFSTIGNLLSSPDFLSSAGNILCGKPFKMNNNKFYKQIVTTKDLSTEPDQAQLDVLPTDFCRSLYLDIINVDGGKIVWSFIKPLIMGKILYTPVNPTVNKIMEKASSTFATMIKLTDLVHSFAKSFPSITKLSSHRAGLDALRNLMTSPQLKSIASMIIGNDTDNGIDMQGLNMDDMLDKIRNSEDMGNLLTKASNLLHCINLNRFQATKDEKELSRQAAKLSTVNEFSAGVVFLNSEKESGSLSNVEYKIRMDIDNVPTTSRLRDYLWIPGPESNFIDNMRYFRGFVQIQDMVDKAIIQLSAGQDDNVTDTQELDWALYTQQTPYPCYTKDYYQTSLYESQSLIVAFFFSLLFTVASTVRFIVSDKETGNTMLMSVMGVNLCWHTLSWFIASFIEMVITMICITIILYAGSILPTTDPTLVFALLFVFGLSILSFCYMISKLFQSASLAAVCGAIVYLISFMPFIIILSLEAALYSSLKLLICLSMSSSMCYAFLYVARYEAHGSGASWAQLWSSPGDAVDMSIGLAGLMMLLDAAIYFVIGWLIDKYFGIKALTSNITHCEATDEKAGVSIINVSKVYNEGSRRSKLALDNVSIELHKGEVTTLLGHNGAGKTTLVNILTGMLKPSSGHVSVRGGGGGGGGGAGRVGACPQRDVLVECLSAREHVQLYAMLNSAVEHAHVAQQVDKMLEVLSLGNVSSEPVSRLSGGTRRRLCVALAFIGDPHLVSLDEPTAGVDPAARRDIWSMIVKLKENKTILLTTHHLDEAELLSDQIVILHKGQIHTMGSPIEIKRAFGNGYKLTVIYPERTLDEYFEDTCQEEKTKHLLSVVRDVVKNANIIDVNGQEVDIALPFFDFNGLHNNFYSLCSVLEAAQTSLGFKNYTMDCSRLEQVFFNVCHQADSPLCNLEYASDVTPPKSVSGSSIRTDPSSQELVTPEGPLKGSSWEQFLALIYIRYLHHIRNRWLLFMLIMLPALFVTVAMGFSTLRPPIDNEIALKLDRYLYKNSTEFIVTEPSKDSELMDSSLAESVMQNLIATNHKLWTTSDSPMCNCTKRHQVCDKIVDMKFPDMMVLPDVNRLNKWLVDTQEMYIEKRYGGYTSSLKQNLTRLVAWYNNKGHHAMVSHVNALNTAILRAVTRRQNANITTYTHPLKISKEPISKATIYQHIADAGVSGLVLVAYALISAGAAIYLVSSRRSQEKRLQLLCGVTPLLYWSTALVWDMLIMLINMGITATVMAAFGFPVFVARNNLPAICLLFLLYGFSCGSLVHVAEKWFSEASMANMVLFCGNAFLGLSFIAILLMMDIISESETTDNARYILHKIFLLSPQFALGDGLLEIAKNTIQAQVLERFGMDTYKDPLSSNLLLLHYCSLVMVGTVLLLLNLSIEYDCFERLLIHCFRKENLPPAMSDDLEPVEVTEERKRVLSSQLHAEPIRVNTIGNINRGFVRTEGSKSSMRVPVPLSDAAACVGLTKLYPGVRSYRLALDNLTLGIPPQQCTALLGQNGAGKSTTFSLLTGQIRPSAGYIYLNNKRVNATQLCNGLISYCPQSDAIDPLLTVTETLKFYCKLRGIGDQQKVIKRTIEMFELGKYAHVRSGALSGGNKRKLCTAIAFMARTPLVLLDEPTSGMDPASRACVWRGARAACAWRRGVLLATHALDDARRLAARVAMLRAGRLVALNSLDECLNRFGGGYVVQCRVSGSAAGAWRRLLAAAPHAALRVLHKHALHALIPTHAIVNNKAVVTKLSDIFRLMAELQAMCEIEDYTVNQSSLDQMFLSFTDYDITKSESEIDIEPIPSILPSYLSTLRADMFSDDAFENTTL